MNAMPARATVVRSLGLAAAISIAVANMIGQGVFLKARTMICNVGAPAPMLGAWLVAGLLALCGALTLAELGAALPESGGIYAFLRRAYGGPLAFAYGWMTAFIASPASIAALAAGAAIFINLSTANALDGLRIAAGPLTFSGVQSTALVLIVVMTAINCAPAIVNGSIATFFAGLKIAMIVGVTGIAFVLGHDGGHHFALTAAGGTCAGVPAALRSGVPGFAAAIIGALYGYQGWQSLTLVAGEVRRPGRTLPVALGVSVALVIVLYVSANAGFVYVLGARTIADLPPSASVGVTVAANLLGPAWRTIAAMLLFASVAATLHVTILSNARVTFAYAGDTLGIPLLARVSARGHVPVNAVLLNSVVAVFLVLIGTFDTLSDYLVFNAWVFFVLTGAAMLVLRRREPGLPRPYRTFGYPVVPLVYVAVGSWLLVQTAIGSPAASGIGLLIVALSYPVYLWRARAGRASPR